MIQTILLSILVVAICTAIHHGTLKTAPLTEGG